MTRGDIWWADFSVPFGSEPGYRRPVLILQDENFNRSRIPTTVIVPLTGNMVLADAPGNVVVDKAASNLAKDSVAVVSHLTAIDRVRLTERISAIQQESLWMIEAGVLLVLGIRKT